MPKAITYTEYGEPEVLRLSEVPTPEPGADQVRVRVSVSGVNPIDWKIRKGFMSGGKPLTRERIPGRDFAGVIDAVGENVSGLAVGQRVTGEAEGGTAAEYILAKPADIAPLPDEVDDITGAAIPVVGRTAIRVLTLAEITAGQTLLIHAATGGVGAFTTQLAISRGIQVIGTASEGNLDYLRSLGATAVAYGEGWEDRVREVAPDGVHAVVDAAGTGVIEGSIELVQPGGKIVTIADFAASGPGVIITSGGEPGFENSLTEAVAAIADGTVHLPVDKTFTLAETAEAHRFSELRHVRGKIVIVVGRPAAG